MVLVQRTMRSAPASSSFFPTAANLPPQDLHFSLAHVFQHLIEVHRIDDALHIVEAAQPLG